MNNTDINGKHHSVDSFTKRPDVKAKIQSMQREEVPAPAAAAVAAADHSARCQTDRASDSKRAVAAFVAPLHQLTRLARPRSMKPLVSTRLCALVCTLLHLKTRLWSICDSPLHPSLHLTSFL